MTKRDWDESHVVGMFLNGEEIAAPDEHGERVVDDSFLLLFNGSHDDVEFKLPPTRFGRRWTVELRTDDPDAEPGAVQASAGEQLGLPHLSLMVLHARELTFRATYRLQLGPGFGFAQARELVPYLHDLGVSHLYLPPSFQARPGSEHGYDVIDPTRFSEELGGEREFDELAAAAKRAGLGLILDIVPNHMAVDDGNRYWADPALRSRFFDIDEATGRHRRFFDIDHLAAVRQEDEHVFEETHRLALRLAREGTVDGLRVDHPDGLADPAGYLRRLRDGGARHVWVEKILDPGERLRDWAVEGTVGYEFLNDVAALFVDPAGEAPLTDLWVELSGDDRPFGEVAFEAKLEQVRGPFAPEVDRLRREAPREVGGLERTLASLPVYRTYVEPWSGLRGGRRPRGDPRGRAARSRSSACCCSASAAGTRSSRASSRPRRRSWPRASRTRPSTATGGCWRSTTSAATRAASASRSRPSTARTWSGRRFPNNLLVTQTHDTKRSGDVRARIGALAGMAGGVGGARAALAGGDARRCAVRTRSSATSSSRRWSGRGRSSSERLEAYVEKALREAKRNTSWIEPDTAYEDRVKAFCRALYEHRPFLSDFEPFAAEVARAGDRAALGAAPAQAHRPGRARHLPGRRAARALAGRPRQPPPRRLGAPPRAAGRGPPRRRSDRRDAQAVADRARPDAARPPARRVRRRLHAASPPATTRSRSCAATPCSPPPPCATSPAGAVDVPAGTWRDALAGGERHIAGADAGRRAARRARRRAARARRQALDDPPPRRALTRSRSEY